MMPDDCEFEVLASALAVSLKSADSRERDLIKRQFVQTHGEQCANQVLLLLSLYESGRETGFDDGFNQGLIMAAQRTPQLWEKILAWSTGISILGISGFLVVRNEPFSDPNFAVIVRTLIVLLGGIFGTAVPGLMQVDVKWKDYIAVRATSGMGLMVILWFYTPTIIVQPDDESTEIPVVSSPDEIGSSGTPKKASESSRPGG